MSRLTTHLPSEHGGSDDEESTTATVHRVEEMSNGQVVIATPGNYGVSEPFVGASWDNLHHDAWVDEAAAENIFGGHMNDLNSSESSDSPEFAGQYHSLRGKRRSPN